MKYIDIYSETILIGVAIVLKLLSNMIDRQNIFKNAYYLLQ